MDIQDIGSGPRLDPTQNSPVSDPDTSSADDASEAGSRDDAGAQDSVEISDEARTAQSDQSSIQVELLRAQQALADAPEVRQDRVEAAQELVDEGRFSDPDVIGDVAEQMVNDIFSESGTQEGGGSQEL